MVAELATHLDQYAEADSRALVFTGPKGAPLRRGNLNKLLDWKKSVTALGRPELHFHDLRHTGNTLAAGTGLSTRDLMARMGHDSMSAALIYQHATREADQAAARALEEKLQAARRRVTRTRGVDEGQGTLFDEGTG